MDFINNKDKFPKVIHWMYGASQSDIYSVHSENSKKILVDISDFALPNDVKSICYIPESPYIFFIRRGKTEELYYLNLGLNKIGKPQFIQDKVKEAKQNLGREAYILFKGKTILELTSDRNYLYILIAEKSRQDTTYSVIKIGNFSSLLNNNPNSLIENKIDFNGEKIDPTNKNFQFIIVTGQGLPEKTYIVVSDEHQLYIARYKNKKGYIIKLTCIEKVKGDLILPSNATDTNGFYYIANNSIWYTCPDNLLERKKQILDLSFLNEKSTALGFFVSFHPPQDNNRLLIIATHYNLYGYNLNKKEFYSLLSHKGTILYREQYNSDSLAHYCLFKDNKQYDIKYDKEGMPISKEVPETYINKICSLFNIGIFFGSDRYNNWGGLLTLHARRLLFSSEELSKIGSNSSNDELYS